MSYLRLNAIEAPTSVYAKIANIAAKKNCKFAMNLAAMGVRSNVTSDTLARVAPEYFTNLGLTMQGKKTLIEIEKELGLSQQANIKQLIRAIRRWARDFKKPFSFKNF